MLSTQEMRDRDEDDRNNEKFLVLRKNSGGNLYSAIISSLDDVATGIGLVLLSRNATARDKYLVDLTLIGINEFK